MPNYGVQPTPASGRGCRRTLGPALMETTEKIVESYCRYVKQWFTIPNVRCKGQYEVDLLAVDTTHPRRLRRFHIECGVSISGSYSKLTDKPFSTKELKVRVKQAGQRRTLGYFIERKFELPEVLAEIRKYGFEPGNYQRVVVTWGATASAETLARAEGVELWDFRTLLAEIAAASKDQRTYFTDDTARTIQLFAKAQDWHAPAGPNLRVNRTRRHAA